MGMGSFIAELQAKMNSAEHLSPAEMDAARRMNTAYEYLCHLEEARL
jgi:hypothetical protein